MEKKKTTDSEQSFDTSSLREIGSGRTDARIWQRRRRREGMTLVEIMVVVIIMALIATGVAVAVLPAIKRANIKSTRTDIQAVRSAVTLWLAEPEHSGCPTVEQLVEDGQLDRSKRVTDAWDNPFIINCDGDEPVISSRGPDEQEGTDVEGI
jgi:general secretion pathway protein G